MSPVHRSSSVLISLCLFFKILDWLFATGKSWSLKNCITLKDISIFLNILYTARTLLWIFVLSQKKLFFFNIVRCVRVCTYVCIYLCIYVCMYVRMYVFMYVWCMYVCTYVLYMYVCVYVCIMYVCMYVCLYVCIMYVCNMYVCVCVCIMHIRTMYVCMHVCVCVYVRMYSCWIYVYVCTSHTFLYFFSCEFLFPYTHREGEPEIKCCSEW